MPLDFDGVKIAQSYSVSSVQDVSPSYAEEEVKVPQNIE